MKIVYKLLSIECLESKFGKNRHSQLDWESIFRFLQQIPNKFLRYTTNFFGMKTTYRIYNLLFVLLVMFSSVVLAQNTTVKIGLLKYKGGGDWYANPTSLKNLASFCNKNLNMQLSTNIDEVEPGSSTLFNYSYIHITGHGNILFTDDEAENLRLYLIAGGFLHISDNYGIDPYIRKAMKKVFPELDFVELPASHPIYHQKYNFNNGLPKIHEHDNKPAKGFGLIYEGRLICFYDYESDLGDGWEDASVHKDAESKRQQALQMGANIISFVCTQ